MRKLGYVGFKARKQQKKEKARVERQPSFTTVGCSVQGERHSAVGKEALGSRDMESSKERLQRFAFSIFK